MVFGLRFFFFFAMDFQLLPHQDRPFSIELLLHLLYLLGLFLNPLFCFIHLCVFLAVLLSPEYYNCIKSLQIE